MQSPRLRWPKLPWLLEPPFLLSFFSLLLPFSWSLCDPPWIFHSVPGVSFLSRPGGSATMQNAAGTKERGLFLGNSSLHAQVVCKGWSFHLLHGLNAKAAMAPIKIWSSHDIERFPPKRPKVRSRCMIRLRHHTQSRGQDGHIFGNLSW